MKSSLFYGLLLMCNILVAQTADETDKYELRIRKTTDPIKTDGLIDEPCWATAQVASDFKLVFPNDTEFSKFKTEVRLTFDDQNLYLAAVCYQKRADYTVQSLRRDYGPGTTDVLNIMLDPTKDGLNGFLFSVSPYNVQREGLIANGDALSNDWDNKWKSAVQNYDDYWTMEMAIPFKTLRYNVSSGENSWGLQFIRTKVKDYEVSTWKPVPFQYRPTNVALGGKLIWETLPPKPGMNISFIPYAIGSYSKDYIRDTNFVVVSRPNDWAGNIGGDVKIALTPGLNLDLTLNPDFSQVEVDRQVANLSRFELFFPERRQFFLENRDLFATFGFPGTRPFFSRRVGLALNPVKNQFEKVPILAGARLSGKINDGLRVGLLNMQTQRKIWDADNATPAANFTMATVQQKIFSRSTISAVFVNKQNTLEPLSAIQKQGWQPWNRVAGLEYNLYSKDNRWEGEAYYHRSLSPDPSKRGSTLAGFLGYRDRYFNANLGHWRIDSTYFAEAGFVPRKGIQGFFPGIGTTWYPHKGSDLSKVITAYNMSVSGDHTLALSGKELDREVNVQFRTTFIEQSEFSIGVYNNYTYLFAPFDPTNLTDVGPSLLPIGGYTTYGFRTGITAGTSYNIQGNIDVNAGGYYKGSILSVEGNLAYRLQPIGLFSVLYSYNRIRQPLPQTSIDLWLLGPQVELAFSRNVFLNAFFQYNNQANNFNVNARLQWRFAPASDIFVVYTDNSYAKPIAQTEVQFLTPINKALVVKVVYWLNL